MIEIWLGLIFVLAVVILSLHSVPKPDAILIFSGLAAVLTPASGIAILFLVRNKGGVPTASPRDYLDKDLIFYLIKDEKDCWLATLIAPAGPTVAIAMNDFVPMDRKAIEQAYQESVQNEKRLKIVAHGHCVREGCLFLLGPGKIQEESQETEKEVTGEEENNQSQN